MTVRGKIKTIDNNIDQNKAHYDLDRQTAKISELSSRNVSKFEFWTGEYVLPEKGLLEKATAMKRFEYLPLGRELNTQTDIAKKQYQRLEKTFISNKDNKNVNESLIKKEKPSVKKCNKSYLIYNRLRFYSYSDDRKLDSLSFKSKYSNLFSFYDDLQ